MSTREEQVKFIKEKLINQILKEHFPEEDLLDVQILNAQSLDGFMSALFKVNLKLRNRNEKKENDKHLLFKFMKGDKSFRESSKSYIQFANEIFIYSKVLPYYEQIIRNSSAGSSIKVSEWIPHVYFAKYGIMDGLGDGTSPDSILALENLNPKGYRSGPSLYLDHQHLLLMTKPIAEYHALTYAMRIRKDSQLERFIQEIIPLPFVADASGDVGKENTNFYDVLYRVAFERFFRYFDKMKETYKSEDNDEKYLNEVNFLRSKYGKMPTALLEKFRKTDETFSVILHGDYNRNNVLFQYDNSEGFENPRDVKMIDFQELRYGTPAIDLSFFMYMNMDPSIRNEFWMELLTFYHQTLLSTLVKILGVDIGHESLSSYSFDKFYEHFSKFAFYGCMVCMHFLPWMLSPKDECAQLSHLFETDMCGDAFWKISIEAGGESVDKEISDVVRHASRMGYMKDL